MLSHKQYNKVLYESLKRRPLPKSSLTLGGVNAYTDSVLESHAVFSLSTGEGINGVPKLTVEPVESSPCAIFKCYTEISVGRFTAYPIPLDRPVLVRASVAAGEICGPLTGYTVSSPGNAMFCCIGQWDDFSLIIQNNYVHQHICRVSSASVTAGSSGTCVIQYRDASNALVDSDVSVPFVNRTSVTRVLNDFIKIKAIVGLGFVLNQ